MSDKKEKENLRDYRLQEAQSKLNAASLLLEGNCYKDSINRSYYAIFNGIRAVLAMDEVDFKKHSQVIGYFNKNYIHTGKFKTSCISIVSMAFQIRNSCDYDDFFIASKADAERQLADAKFFLSEVESFF